MITVRNTTIIAAAVILAALAGCGAGGSASHPASSAAPPAASQAQPANPVPILRQTGAVPDPGTIYGDHTVSGGRVANGTLPGGGESVRVVTVPPGTLPSYMAGSPDAKPDDSHAIITGRDFYVALTAEPVGPGGTLPYGYKVPPAVIAARVHGTVVHAR